MQNTVGLEQVCSWLMVIRIMATNHALSIRGGRQHALDGPFSSPLYKVRNRIYNSMKWMVHCLFFLHPLRLYYRMKPNIGRLSLHSQLVWIIAYEYFCPLSNNGTHLFLSSQPWTACTGIPDFSQWGYDGWWHIIGWYWFISSNSSPSIVSSTKVHSFR